MAPWPAKPSSSTPFQGGPRSRLKARSRNPAPADGSNSNPTWSSAPRRGDLSARNIWHKRGQKMSVSISERGDTAISDIIAGGPGFELRLKQFRETAAQAEEAKATIRRANALMREAEEKLA